MEEKEISNSGFLSLRDNIEFFPRWRNSSNVLCNYMRKKEYLERIIRMKAITPRYNIEPIDYLGIENHDRLCFPMTCFCDIPFSKVATHMSRYGEYGIGFSKESLIKQHRVQPIQYVNPDSPLACDFKDAFLAAEKNENISEGLVLTLLNYLTTTLLYMKPIYGYESNASGEQVFTNYQDECEWRYIPSSFPENLELIIGQDRATSTTKETYSDALANHSECWIDFDWDDVIYLIVPDEAAAKDIIKTIMELELSLQEKYLLISKIEISKHFTENM